jgi:dsDNA-binding SOS-regulon protein
VRDLAPFGLRIPVDLKDRIKRTAIENNRSISAEIIYALEKEYPAPSSVAEIQKKLDRLMEKTVHASSDEERRDLVDHLAQIRRELASVIEESAQSQAQEFIERERKKNAPVSESDIPF